MVRSRLSRSCWIWALSGWHSGAWPVKSEKNPSLAAALSGPRQQAIEIDLLLAGQIFIALDLFGPRRVAAAPIERGHMAFEPHADRIGGRWLFRCGRRRRARLARNGRRRHRRLGGGRGRKQAGSENADAEAKTKAETKAATKTGTKIAPAPDHCGTPTPVPGASPRPRDGMVSNGD